MNQKEKFLEFRQYPYDWEEVDNINLDKLKSLAQPVARICTIHTGDGASKADSDTAKGLEPELLLTRNARVMLTANIWVSAGLVNGVMRTITDILFKEKLLYLIGTNMAQHLQI